MRNNKTQDEHKTRERRIRNLQLMIAWYGGYIAAKLDMSSADCPYKEDT